VQILDQAKNEGLKKLKKRAFTIWENNYRGKEKFLKN